MFIYLGFYFTRKYARALPRENKDMKEDDFILLSIANTMTYCFQYNILYTR
jgi:hypothetical protein